MKRYIMIISFFALLYANANANLVIGENCIAPTIEHELVSCKGKFSWVCGKLAVSV